jgi:hypothetical protein
MNTHLMTGVAVIFGLIAFAASRDLLQRLRAKQRLVPVRIRPALPARDERNR